MPRRGAGFVLLMGALLALLGCHSTQPYLRPPKPPEELREPPVEEARFSEPPNYPKEALNQDRLGKPDNVGGQGGAMPKGSMNRPGGGPGAGGY